jgi:iron complex transport system ATP-binding protein
MTLSAVDLSVGYHGVAVCRNITFSFAKGEMVCVLGPNGSGKTTLFKSLLGPLLPLAGFVEINGVKADHFSRHQYARQLAYVPQVAMSYFPYRIIDMVLMGRTPHIDWFAVPSAHDRSVAHASLERLGIAHLNNRLFGEVSGGERQLTLIARALAQEASIVILDEPTASLDFGNQTRVIGTLRELADIGLTIVFSTHEPSHAFAGANTAVLVKAGTMLAHGAPREVVTSDSLKSLYGIDVAIEYLAAAERYVCAPRFTQANKGERR